MALCQESPLRTAKSDQQKGKQQQQQKYNLQFPVSCFGEKGKRKCVLDCMSLYRVLPAGCPGVLWDCRVTEIPAACWASESWRCCWSIKVPMKCSLEGWIGEELMECLPNTPSPMINSCNYSLLTVNSWQLTPTHNHLPGMQGEREPSGLLEDLQYQRQTPEGIRDYKLLEKKLTVFCKWEIICRSLENVHPQKRNSKNPKILYQPVCLRKSCPK